MKVLTRYLAKEVLIATAMTLLAFLALFLFFDFINELDAIGKEGYELKHAILYVALISPGRIYELLPVVVLIGTLYALTTLARNSEITVMRASGMSTKNLLFTLTSIGLTYVAATFIFGEYIAPPAERIAKQLKLTVTGDTVSQQLNSGFWIKDGTRIINVGVVMPDHSLHFIRIHEFDDHGRLTSLSQAQTGEYIPESGNWRLDNVSQTSFEDGQIRVTTPGELAWHSNLSPDVLSVLMVDPAHMTIVSLYTYIRHLKDNQQNANRYDIALWKKITYPFAVLVMMALALPFGFFHDRMGGVGAKVFVGVMLGVGFHLLNGLFSNLGIIASWSPAISAFAPSIIFMIAAITMLYWVERR